MRGRSWPLALLALFAFGWVPRLFTLALILGAIVLTGYLEWKFSGVPHSIPAIIALGALGVLAYVVTLVGLAFIGQGIRSAMAGPATKNIDARSRLAQLERFTSMYATPRSTTLRQLIIGAVLIILVVLLGFFRPALYAAAVLVGFAASMVIAIGLLTSILLYISRFKSHAFGLIPGATPRTQRSTLLDAWRESPSPQSRKPWFHGSTIASTLSPDYHLSRFCDSGICGRVWTIGKMT